MRSPQRNRNPVPWHRPADDLRIRFNAISPKSGSLRLRRAYAAERWRWPSGFAPDLSWSEARVLRLALTTHAAKRPALSPAGLSFCRCESQRRFLVIFPEAAEAQGIARPQS